LERRLSSAVLNDVNKSVQPCPLTRIASQVAALPIRKGKTGAFVFSRRAEGPLADPRRLAFAAHD
jgi:hypothetical protein